MVPTVALLCDPPGVGTVAGGAGAGGGRRALAWVGLVGAPASIRPGTCSDALLDASALLSFPHILTEALLAAGGWSC